jgi:hypothetical protein
MSANQFNFPTAPLNSPAFTGVPTAPTASPGTNTTQIATTAFVSAASGWTLTGNSGTTAGTNYQGTSDNVDVVYKRNAVEKIRIASSQVTLADRIVIGTGFPGGSFGIAANNFVFGSDAVAMGSNQWRTTAGSSMSTTYLVGGGSVGSHTIVNNGRYEWQSNGGYIFSENGVERLRILNDFNFNIGQNNYNLLYKGQTNASLFYIKASTDNIGLGTTSPNASAILDLSSTTQGLGLPQMTTAQINAIVSPKAGLIVYNTTLAVQCFYDGSGWRKVTHTNM